MTGRRGSTRALVALALLAASVVVLTPAVVGAGSVESATVLHDDPPEEVGLWGGEVAIDGDRIVMSTRRNANSGFVVVFDRQPDASFERTELHPTSPFRNYNGAIAVDGDRIVAHGEVEANHDEAVAVFDRQADGTYERRVLSTSLDDGGDAGTRPDFGAFGLDVDGDRIVVGSPQDDGQGANTGSVTVFDEQPDGTFTETRLTPDTPTSKARFGSNVAVDGNRIVASSSGDTYNRSVFGAVYVFDEQADGTFTSQRITRSDSEADDGFGYPLALHGDRIVSDGVVIDLHGDGTYTERHLTPVSGTHGGLGGDVSVDGSRIVFGAAGSRCCPGEVTIFDEGSEGQFTRTLVTPPLTADGDRFGESVAVAGDRLAVLAPLGDVDGLYRAGYLAVFDLPSTTGLDQCVGFTNDFTAGDDIIEGTSGDDILVGGPGNDTIIGHGGNDIICGGPGDDVLDGGDGDDVLLGGSGDDVLKGRDGHDDLHAGAGDDTAIGGGGNDRLNGGPGADALEGRSGADELDGGPDGDVVDGGAGPDDCVDDPADSLAFCNPV